MTSCIDTPAPAEAYDDAQTFLIPSDNDPHAKYMVRLAWPWPAYPVCSCTHFQTHLEPHCKAGIRPEDALARGLVKLIYNKDPKLPIQTPAMALCCKHIIRAFLMGGMRSSASFTYAETHQNEANPY